jgi:hypothetical protein
MKKLLKNPRIERRSAIAGRGCAIQAAGCVLPVLGALVSMDVAVLGMLPALGLFVYGGLVRDCRCSECGQRVPRADLRRCRGCGVEFQK